MRLRLLDSSPRSVDCGTTYIYTYNFFSSSCSTTLGVPVLSLLLDPVSLSGLFFLLFVFGSMLPIGLASALAWRPAITLKERIHDNRRPTPKARRGDGLVDNISIFFFFLFQFFLVSVPESRRERGVIDGDETPAGACTVLRGSGGSHVAPFSSHSLKKKKKLLGIVFTVFSDDLNVTEKSRCFISSDISTNNKV